MTLCVLQKYFSETDFWFDFLSQLDFLNKSEKSGIIGLRIRSFQENISVTHSNAYFFIHNFHVIFTNITQWFYFKILKGPVYEI